MARTAKPPAPAPGLIADLVAGNRILFDQNVVDAFGHISARHDKDPALYLMARNLAPGLVGARDIAVFDLDSAPLTLADKRHYLERFIHGEIYKARPDVTAVVHCHAPPLIPFAAAEAKLRPIFHMAGFLGQGVARFEIREAGGMTDMLIRSPALGRALACTLADKPVVLMRGHGATLVGASVRQAVYRAIYAAANAGLQLAAAPLGAIAFLAEEEAAKAAATNDGAVDRPWELWKARALGRRAAGGAIS